MRSRCCLPVCLYIPSIVARQRLGCKASLKTRSRSDEYSRNNKVEELLDASFCGGNMFLQKTGKYLPD
jgi:hypothetical protein